MIRKEHFEIGETAVTIITDDAYMEDAMDAVLDARAAVEAKIYADPFFGMTYDPYEESEDDHSLIKRMCRAARIAGVGPMASVAGAVASHALERIYWKGCRFAILDNGGDIALCTDRDVLIGIHQHDERFDNLAFRIPPSDKMRGVCSSSGQVGYSVSFGVSDITTVFADDPVLADACATAAGNMVKDEEAETIAEAAGSIDGMPGAEGCVVICGGRMASYGKVPEMVIAEETDATSVWFPRVNVFKGPPS